jgi:hypothetical protein
LAVVISLSLLLLLKIPKCNSDLSNVFGVIIEFSFSMFNSLFISFKTADEAVPVNAIILGQLPFLAKNVREFLAIFRYDVLKSCPHSDIQ